MLNNHSFKYSAKLPDLRHYFIFWKAYSAALRINVRNGGVGAGRCSLKYTFNTAEIW